MHSIGIFVRDMDLYTELTQRYEQRPGGFTWEYIERTFFRPQPRWRAAPVVRQQIGRASLVLQLLLRQHCQDRPAADAES